MIFSILGLTGEILSDILFDLKGKGNKKFGTSGNIDSNANWFSLWDNKLRRERKIKHGKGTAGRAGKIAPLLPQA